MELWMAVPGDKIRIPRHYPEVATVTDAGIADRNHDRLHWEAPGSSGSTVLSRQMEVDLLSTEEPTKQAYVVSGTEG